MQLLVDAADGRTIPCDFGRAAVRARAEGATVAAANMADSELALEFSISANTDRFVAFTMRHSHTYVHLVWGVAAVIGGATLPTLRATWPALLATTVTMVAALAVTIAQLG